MISPVVKMLRERLSNIGEYLACLYQQFDTDDEGRLVRHFGNESGKKIETFLFPTGDTIPGNIDFDLTALSETENPQTQMQQSLMISQVTQNYFGVLFKALEILKNPQMGSDPDVKSLVVKTIEVLGRTHQHFLEAAEFDEAQDVIFKLQDQGVQNAQALNQFGQLLSQIGGTQLSQPGAGPPPNGSAGAPGVAGVPAMAGGGGGGGGSGSLGFA
jgi:hypothetical protein